jgi:hypothetical protein
VGQQVTSYDLARDFLQFGISTTLISEKAGLDDLIAGFNESRPLAQHTR